MRRTDSDLRRIAKTEELLFARLIFDEIEPAGRMRHARRREFVVNSCRVRSGFANRGSARRN